MTMLYHRCCFLAVLIFLASNNDVVSAFENLVGYEPRTLITDHAAIDLDLKALEDELSFKQLTHARHVYENGGYSNSIAAINLIDPMGPRTFHKGTRVYGYSHLGNNEVLGFLNDTYSWGTGTGKNETIYVEYFTSDVQQVYSNCHVGALYEFEGADLDGCFSDGGVIMIAISDTQVEKFEYTYVKEDIRASNINGRTLQQFSTLANEEMRHCPQCPYFDDFKLFADYYGNIDYADKWITAAFHNRSTAFNSGRGNARFEYSEVGLAESVSRGIVAMSVYMKVIQMMEHSIDDCFQTCRDGECNDDKTNSLDVALAYYSGSMEGPDGSGEGNMLYNLADIRARDFRTAGVNGDEESGTSFVNLHIVREMKRAQKSLSQLKCEEADAIKKNIIDLMKVPLVQSVLRFAYIRQYDLPAEPQNIEKMDSQAATFTAAILPYLHFCNQVDADFVYTSMMAGSSAANVDYARIKQAFEDNYECLNLTCERVGGVWSIDDYAPGGEPCTFVNPIVGSSSNAESKSGGRSAGKVLLILLIVSLVSAVGFFVYSRSRRTNNTRHFPYKTPGRNIAAVSEIA